MLKLLTMKSRELKIYGSVVESEGFRYVFPISFHQHFVVSVADKTTFVTTLKKCSYTRLLSDEHDRTKYAYYILIAFMDKD